MLTALGFGLLASSALLLGGVLGAFWRAPHRLTGILLAFASGTLISALAFELFPYAVATGGRTRSALGLLLGAGAFVALNQWVDRRVAAVDRTAGASAGSWAARRREARTVGLALLIAVTLDGVPENLALGVALDSDAGLPLLAAIFASNFPEALVGANAMQRGGKRRTDIVWIWLGTTVLLTATVVLGRFLGQLPDTALALMASFAGGAVLASLADTLMPEAFERGQPWNAFATCAGFLLSFLLAEL